ncbi:hypothetical protein H7F33_15680 [Pedobacter sp. PAMC26386]|nr:hypothetical protein H7F33_15680 [Pedobacter sp. PAMC26386]
MFCTVAFAQSTVKPSPKALGGDRDKHGCIGSAGYTFSVIKNDCVRLFEQKPQLKEVNPKGSYTSNATVIFSSDNKKAELFVPHSKSSIILNRTGDKANPVWKKGKFSLSQKDNNYKLKESNKVTYTQVP